MIHRKKNRKYKRRRTSPEIYGLNLERDEEMLALYKRGLTLQQIGDRFEITRSRVQQIIFRTLRRKILKELRTHIYSNPDKKPVKTLVKEEVERIRSKKRQSWLERKLTAKALQGIIPEKFTSEAKFAVSIGVNLNTIRDLAPDVIQIIRDNRTIGLGGKRWSRFYLRCRMCGTTSVHHQSHGYCRKCYPKTDHFKEIQEASRLRNQHRWEANQKKYQLEYYDKKHYGGNRLRVLKRDGFKCLRCSLTEKESKEQFGERLRVLHLGSGNDHRPYNLLTLCRRCSLKFLRMKKTFKQTDMQILRQNFLQI